MQQLTSKWITQYSYPLTVFPVSRAGIFLLLRPTIAMQKKPSGEPLPAGQTINEEICSRCTC